MGDKETKTKTKTIKNENENDNENDNENENEYKKINEDSASPGMVAGGAGLNIQHNERICNIRS